jgi:hypothetical protein
MPPVSSSDHSFPDWQELWLFGACWAGRPVPGVILPQAERTRVMVAVMNSLMDTFGHLPGELQCRAFIHSQAVRLALESTRAARAASANPQLWHDPAHRRSTPALDLAAMQREPHSPVWAQLLISLKPVSLQLLRSDGLSDADAEDVFAEALAGLVQTRASGTAILQDLLVYEQLPSLFTSILRRRQSNFLRDSQAAKRSAAKTISLHSEDPSLPQLTDHQSWSQWLADEADPLRGMTLTRLATECGHCLSPMQQHILSVLYIQESMSYMELAASPWFLQAVGLKATASEATLRRALDSQHDSALDLLAQCIGLPRHQD